MSGEDSTSLASKCMAFCQTLASQGQVFNFSLSIGPDFSFSLDTRSKAVKTQETKKRSSPSTLRRNARRRAEFNAKKQQISPSRISSGENTELLPSPEKERGPTASGELQLSPNHVQREEIKLSEEESASPIGKPPTPSSTWTTSPLDTPPGPRACGLTRWSRGPKCKEVFNCLKDYRCHAHEVHHLCMKVLHRDPVPCSYPGCL